MGNVNMVFDAETAKAVNAFIKIENKTRDLDRRQQELAEKGKKRSKSSLDGLGKEITKYISLSAGIKAAQAALESYTQAQKESASFLRGRDRGMGSLAQLAKNREELKRMVGEAEKSMSEEGMTSDEAGALQFALDSGGKGDKRKLYSRLYGMADPTQMLESVITMQEGMGLSETGADRQVLDKAFAASASTKTNVGDLMRAASLVAKQAKNAGSTDEELLATMSELARGEATPNLVSTQLSGLITAASKKASIKTGGGLLDIVKQIKEKNLDAKGLNDLLGSKEAVNAYLGINQAMPNIIANKKTLEQVDEAAATGKGDYTGQRVTAYHEVFGLEREERISKARAELNDKRLGEEELKKQIIINRQKSRSVDENDFYATRVAKEWALKGMLMFSSGNTEAIDEMYKMSGERESIILQKQQIEETRRQTEAIEGNKTKVNIAANFGE